ncbi:AraC family transcriptional regulator [Arenibacter latericius]|uniref:AraC family transcriptional regulator n=1 Tax=Arenibacter latericius TaxID=86104 RepID=UPI0004298C8E|nr:AraC family transcriptional regulator [Arenibacter latericius]MDX1365602.1 AraC family transcriptional regulator [Arenibacter latericius]
MEFIFENIYVPTKHSFISRKLPLASNARIHSHKNFELNFITSGSGRRIVGDNISGFEKGDLVLLGPNLPHCWEVLDVEKGRDPFCIVTHFSEDIINSDFFKMPELEQVVDLLKQSNTGLRFKLEDDSYIRSILEKMTLLTGLEYYIQLLSIFNYLIQEEDRENLSNPNSNTPIFSKNLDKINKVYEYVFQNIQDGVKLEEAASVLNMAPSSFCRYFKKKTSLTFMEYVKSVRVGIAAKLLAETDKQITQICFESGYNNLANFNHYFKFIMGKTPSEYRKTFR